MKVFLIVTRFVIYCLIIVVLFATDYQRQAIIESIPDKRIEQIPSLQSTNPIPKSNERSFTYKQSQLIKTNLELESYDGGIAIINIEAVTIKISDKFEGFSHKNLAKIQKRIRKSRLFYYAQVNFINKSIVIIPFEEKHKFQQQADWVINQVEILYKIDLVLDK